MRGITDDESTKNLHSNPYMLFDVIKTICEQVSENDKPRYDNLQAMLTGVDEYCQMMDRDLMNCRNLGNSREANRMMSSVSYNMYRQHKGGDMLVVCSRTDKLKGEQLTKCRSETEWVWRTFGTSDFFVTRQQQSVDRSFYTVINLKIGNNIVTFSDTDDSFHAQFSRTSACVYFREEVEYNLKTNIIGDNTSRPIKKILRLTGGDLEFAHSGGVFSHLAPNVNLFKSTLVFKVSDLSDFWLKFAAIRYDEPSGNFNLGEGLCKTNMQLIQQTRNLARYEIQRLQDFALPIRTFISTASSTAFLDDPYLVYRKQRPFLYEYYRRGLSQHGESMVRQHRDLEEIPRVMKLKSLGMGGVYAQVCRAQINRGTEGVLATFIRSAVAGSQQMVSSKISEDFA